MCEILQISDQGGDIYAWKGSSTTIQKAIEKKRLKYVKEEKLFILETLILYKY